MDMALTKKMSEKFEGLAAMIGNTPMLEISLKYKGEKRTVYAKAEYYNYSGSIKDRIAYYIMKEAYDCCCIKEGDMVAEATSGNTGIAFSAVCAYLGNPVTIFMPDWMSKERVNLMKSLGATIRSVSKEEGGFTGAIALADKMGEEGVFLPHQFSNQKNVEAHYKTTGKEILEQLAKFNKTPDGVVCGVGTGGTLMGIKKALQEVNPKCKAFPLDPANSPTMASGGANVGPHMIAGIGDEFIPEIVKLHELDEIIMVDDGDAINMSRKISREFGMGVGISSGANLLGALKAQDILFKKDSTIVTVFADDNKKYLSTELMYEQQTKPEHMTPDVELIDFRAIR